MKRSTTVDQLILLENDAGCSDADSATLAAFHRLLAPAVPTEVLLTYWRFAAERQNIFVKRMHQVRPPWTRDAVLMEYKFTNAYRAADRVSQYLIAKVQYDKSWSLNDVVFRTLLFKIFNRIETWELLSNELGDPQLGNFSVTEYSRALGKAMSSGTRIYSAAYIMPSGGPNSGFPRKHDMHLRLLSRMMDENLPTRLNHCESMREAFALIRAYPTIGDFLGYQYVTDINYSEATDFSEMEFVVAGPGAKEGLEKCFSDFGGLSESQLITRMAKIQHEAFSLLSLDFKPLGGRPLQLIDCQNIFCEVAKYARVVHPSFTPKNGRTRIKQRFTAHDESIHYFFPPKWSLAPLN